MQFLQHTVFRFLQPVLLCDSAVKRHFPRAVNRTLHWVTRRVRSFSLDRRNGHNIVSVFPDRTCSGHSVSRVRG